MRLDVAPRQGGKARACGETTVTGTAAPTDAGASSGAEPQPAPTPQPDPTPGASTSTGVGNTTARSSAGSSSADNIAPCGITGHMVGGCRPMSPMLMPMTLGQHQLELLSALGRATERLENEAREATFTLLRMSGGRIGVKPGLDTDRVPIEADITDLEREGLVHTSRSDSNSAILNFALSAEGRHRSHATRVVPDIQRPRNENAPPPPSAEQLLHWIAELDQERDGIATLETGGAFSNAVIQRFGEANVQLAARRVFELSDDGLIALDDIGGSYSQMMSADRLGMAGNIRLTAAGRDRVSAPPGPAIGTQIIQVIQGQVAAGDIHNYTTFLQLLDRAEAEVDQVEGIDDEAKAEAKGLLVKLRAGAGTVGTQAAGSAGGTVLGAIFKQLLGLG